MMKKALILALTLELSTPSFGIDVSEFFHLTAEHKSRISRNALIVFQNFSHIFKNLSPELIQAYLKIHDRPKFFTLKKLQEFGYTHSETIGERLAKSFGKNKESLSGMDKKDLQDAIDWLNKIEDQLKSDFFIENGIARIQTQELEMIELAVDITDTGLKRSLEVGHHGSPYSSQVFLSKLTQNSDVIQISRWLEDRVYSQQIQCKMVLSKN